MVESGTETTPLPTLGSTCTGRKTNARTANIAAMSMTAAETNAMGDRHTGTLAARDVFAGGAGFCGGTGGRTGSDTGNDSTLSGGRAGVGFNCVGFNGVALNCVGLNFVRSNNVGFNFVGSNDVGFNDVGFNDGGSDFGLGNGGLEDDGLVSGGLGCCRLGGGGLVFGASSTFGTGAILANRVLQNASVSVKRASTALIASSSRNKRSAWMVAA